MYNVRTYVYVCVYNFRTSLAIMNQEIKNSFDFYVYGMFMYFFLRFFPDLIDVQQ